MSIFGAPAIRVIAVLGGVAVFAVFQARFMYLTWNAGQGTNAKAPPLDPDDVKIATALAGTLGGLFAAALGVAAIQAAAAGGARLRAAFTVGRTISASNAGLAKFLGTIAVWCYFLAGIAAAVTWQFNKPVTPLVTKTLAEVIAGYVLALIAALGASR